MSKMKVQKNLCYGGSRSSSVLLAFILFAWGATANALCMFENDQKIQLHMSPESGTWGTFDGNQLVTASKVFKCQDDVGRFLMISLGSAHWGLNSDEKNNFIFNSYEPNNCSLENSKSITSSGLVQKKSSANRQFNFLRRCMEIHVIDLAGGNLVSKPQQNYCQVEHTGPGAATLRGDMCFIKIRPSNQFAIQPAIKKECLDPAYLQQMGIQPQDIMANLNVMVTGDDSGVSTDVQHIGSRSVQVNIAPKPGLFNLSESYGSEVPRFVTQYNIDADWGPVVIKSRDSTEISLSFLVSNLMEEKCTNNSCASTSNFIQPFFGQVELFRLRKDRSAELIEEWWDGGLVPPNWQGFVKGLRFRAPEQIIKPGARYRIVATFQNPTDDYAIFLNGLKQMLIRQYDTEGATVGIDSLPAISTLKDLGIIPGFMGIPDLNSNNQRVPLNETLKGLERIISSPVWPPYYAKICADQGACVKLGNQKYHQRLVLEFTASPISESGIINLENLALRKDSTFSKGYPMQKAEFPAYNCLR